MKICLIADALSIHTIRWAEYLIAQGDEVHLITYEPPQTDIQGINLHVISSLFQSLYLSFIPRHIKIYFLVRKIKPDIIHAHFITKFGFHAAFLGMHPVVMSAWGDDILVIPQWSKLLWYFTKICLNRADKIYAVSEDIAKRIISNFKIPVQNVETVPIGVNTELFQPIINQNKSNKIIVFSNRSLEWQYNIETLLYAAKIIKSKNLNIIFQIVGDGKLSDKLKSMANELDINDTVTFLGYIEGHNNLPKYLNQCEIYVSTAITDGTPVSVLEAMSCGCACIATNVGGVPEWIQHNVNGVLIPPQNPDHLANTIIELANDAEKRKRIGIAARKTILEKGDWNTIMKRIRNDYRKLSLYL